LELTPDHLRTAQTCGCVFLETHATLLPLIGGQTPGRERGSEETAQEAAVADAEAAAEIATEQGAARGGAQVVRRHTSARPGGTSRGGKRGV